MILPGNDRLLLLKQKDILISLTLIIICILAIYAGTASYPFHFDDKIFISDNPNITGLSRIPGLFLYTDGPIAERPTHLATFALQHALGMHSPGWFHLGNVLLHALNASLLFMLLLRLLNLTSPAHERTPFRIALIASLIFAVHPLQVESVTYISGRAELLATLMYLSGMLLFLRACEPDVSITRRRALTVALTLVSLLGMGAKEHFASFPLMLLALDYVFISKFFLKRLKLNLSLHIPVWTTLLYLAYLMSRYGYNNNVGFEVENLSAASYFLTQLHVHMTYLRMFLLPVGLNLDHDYPVTTTLLTPLTSAALLAYLSLWGTSVYLLLRKRMVGFWPLWFMLTLAPTSSIVPVIDVIFEHRMYLPLIGLSVLLSIAIEGVMRRRFRIAQIVTIIIVAALAVTSIQRNQVWRNDISLWQDVVAKSPKKLRGYTNLGTALVRADRLEETLQLFERGRTLLPGETKIYYQLGIVYQRMNRLDLALENYERSLALQPDNSDALAHMGELLRTIGDVDRATAYLLRAIELNPVNSVALNSIGLIHQSRGEFEQAFERYEQAFVIDRESANKEGMASNMANMGLARFQMQQVRDACELWRESLELFAQSGEDEKKETVESWLRAYCQ